MRYVGLERKKTGNRRFSGGMKQRLGLAQALVHEQRLLIWMNLFPRWIRRGGAKCLI
ncbi:hypothetical protein PO124_15295 [Bacillus licheniformis]|nr:hypothetical protein [Bacillus licheniformis]